MGRKYLAFDIETAKEVPGVDFDWKPHRPLGISCIACQSTEDEEPRVWFTKNAAWGLRLPGKLAGVEGIQAPSLWAEGKFDTVIDYVTQDVRSNPCISAPGTCKRTGVAGPS